MFWLIIPLMVLVTSCSSLPKDPYDVTYVQPTFGQQMDMDSVRDYHLDRLR